MGDSTLVDPLGRAITLHERTWFGHIVKGHPEVTTARHLVEQALEAPEEIRHSASDPDCRLYYGPGPRPGLIMMVVVDVMRGRVKTAHLARRTTGAGIEWRAK
ncbi:MAG: hypothetical protein V2A79_04670 [Planctomycetota bacterium]